MSGSATCWTHCGQHCERNYYVMSWVHCEHIDGNIVKEIKMCTAGTLSSHWCVHCDRNQNVPSGHIEITLMGTLWSQSKCAYWAHWTHMARHILNVFKFPPLGTLWSLVDCDHNVFSMYPPGIWPLAPSDKGSRLEVKVDDPRAVLLLELLDVPLSRLRDLWSHFF